jgi:hypothetical protein
LKSSHKALELDLLEEKIELQQNKDSGKEFFQELFDAELVCNIIRQCPKQKP